MLIRLADLGLRWAQSPNRFICHAVAHFIIKPGFHCRVSGCPQWYNHKLQRYQVFTCKLFILILLKKQPDAVAWSLACPLCKQVAPGSTIVSSTFFCEFFFPSFADLRRASCQLLGKEWPLNTGNTIPSLPQLFTMQIKQQIKQNKQKPSKNADLSNIL